MFSKNKPFRSNLTTYFRKGGRSHQLLLLLLACGTIWSSVYIESASGQVTPTKPASKAPSEDEKKYEPENVTLETSDKVELVCTYYPPKPPAKSTDEKDSPKTEAQPIDGKRIIPYIILHDWDSSRTDTQALAKFLSAQGNAVITPDLRGHGDSIRVTGVSEAIDAANFRQNEIGAILGDVEACKKFLVKKNNAGELNVDMLSVIAIGETAPLATQWVVKDWSYTPFRNGIKQGQDVKFLILIAPEKKFGPFTMTRITGAPIFNGVNALPTIVAWATSSENAKDSQSIYTRLEKKRPNANNASAEAKTLFQAPLKNSSMSGVAIGSDAKLNRLWQFFHKTVSDKINQNLDKVPWQDRSKEP